ncbi:MAG: hypothetical protein ACE5KZ_11300 [Candidatus Scalinduaceae bacterium]
MAKKISKKTSPKAKTPLKKKTKPNTKIKKKTQKTKPFIDLKQNV